MSVSTPQRLSPRSTDPTDRPSHDSAHHTSERRSFPGWRWMAVWPAFPVAGYVGWKVGGRVDAVDAALVGGAEPASAPSSGGRPRARSGARQRGSAPAPSATPSGWRPAPRWSAMTPTSARSR
jgi:hypothetical protein